MTEGARLLGADWVVPIATPPVRDGAVLLDRDGTVRAVGPRRSLAREGVLEERFEGALLPALVNAHTHLELAHLAGQVPGGEGLVRWAAQLLGRARPTGTETGTAAMAAARAAVSLGTAAVGDVGNSVAAVPAIDEAGLGGIFFHELLPVPARAALAPESLQP